MHKRSAVSTLVCLFVVRKELPEQWNNTKKLAISIKQQVAPLQANEVANIRRKLAEFDSRQQEFREDFRKIAVFSYSCTNPYDELDKVSSVAINYSTSQWKAVLRRLHSVRLSVPCLCLTQEQKLQQHKIDGNVAHEAHLRSLLTKHYNVMWRQEMCHNFQMKYSVRTSNLQVDV